jgi:hypothetical protein
LFASIVRPGKARVKPQNVVVFEERLNAQGFAQQLPEPQVIVVFSKILRFLGAIPSDASPILARDVSLDQRATQAMHVAPIHCRGGAF